MRLILTILLLTSCSGPNALLETIAPLRDARMATLGISLSPVGDPPSIGACVMVTDDVCLTAAHVISTEEVTVVSLIKRSGDVIVSRARVMAVNPVLDLALLQLTTPELFDTRVTIANVLPMVGERVYAIGSPDGFPHVVSDGILSSRANCGTMAGFRCYKISAIIRPGNSGGPVVNSRGELIGIAKSYRGNAAAVTDRAGSVIGITYVPDFADNIAVDLPTIRHFLLTNLE